MVDYEREWNEIEAEERRVRIELDQALPGDPLLGHATSSQQSSPLPEIPFEVITTRYGTVYHLNQNCKYLTAPMTGAAKIHKLVCDMSNGSGPDWNNSWAWCCFADGWMAH